MSDFSNKVDLTQAKGEQARVRLSLTLEGWIYLVILSFVSVCAVLRNVNLLIIFTGIMIGPLFFSWRIGRAIIREVSARRNLQTRIHVGQIVNIQWQVTNHRLTPAWYVTVKDSISNKNHQSSERKQTKKERKSRVGSSKVVFDFIAGNSSKYLSYRALFTSRGEYEIGPAKVTSVFPLGLLSSWFKITDTESFLVAPRIGQLNPNWERRIASMVFGNQSVKRRRGTEPDEFYAIRGWRSGDSRRNIHWRSTAKLGEPMVKEFDQRSNRDLALVLDLFSGASAVSLANDTESSEVENCEKVLSFAASILSQLGSLTRGRVAVAVAGAENAYFTSGQNADFTSMVMRYLATVRSGASPDLEQAVNQVASNVSHGTPIMLFSTRQLTEDKLQSEFSSAAWQRLSSRLRVVYCHSAEFNSLFAIPDPYFDRQVQQLKDDLPLKSAKKNEGTNVST